MKAVSLGVRGYFHCFLQTWANSPVHGFLSPRAASMALKEDGERPEYSHWLYATCQVQIEGEVRERVWVWLLGAQNPCSPRI